MFPLMLDLKRVPVLLAGQGEVVEKRLAQLDEASAAHVTVVCAEPSEALGALAGKRLIIRALQEHDIKAHTVIMIAGFDRMQSELIAAWARQHHRLFNAEDIMDLCDFYFTAHIRRGDLVIAVSTSGASPTLARKVRDIIGDVFGPEWTDRTRLLAEFRNTLKAGGAGMKEVASKSEQFLKDKGWLKGGGA